MMDDRHSRQVSKFVPCCKDKPLLSLLVLFLDKVFLVIWISDLSWSERATSRYAPMIRIGIPYFQTANLPGIMV